MTKPFSKKALPKTVRDLYSKLDDAAWKWREIAECNRRLEREKSEGEAEHK